MKTASNSRVLRTIPLLLIVALLCPFAYGNVIYVDDDAVGANDGTGWENAYVYLQDALADAAGANNGMVWGNASIYLQDALADTKDSEKPVEIRVAQGVYTPDRGKNQTTGDRWATFQLINGVTLMGGFAGLGAADPNTRNIKLYETILSGDLNGDDGALLNSNIENSYHVVTGSWTDVTAVMDGFTIRDGNANRRCHPDFAGGGMFIDSGSPTVANCAFIANEALDGGGMSNDNDSNPNLISCTFNGNLADWGGGMGNVHGSSPTLTNCRFIGNHATKDGGGMYNGKEGNPMLINCTLSGNSAGRGGGMQCDYCSSIRLVNTILWNDGPDEIFLHQSSVTATYSDIQGGWPGEGNIDIDPLFADPYNGDFHLKSQAGRWDEFSESWVIDDVTSPCIDAGDPNSPVAFEPYPNGGVINMGAYGGTAEASKSPSGAHTKYGGGTGEPNDPYQITTAEDLILLGKTPEDYDKHFKLMADIDLSGYTYDRAVIAPDMDDTNYYSWGEAVFDGIPFTGTFDGNSHTISQLTIAGVSHLGLFGKLDYGASISNLGLEVVDINGVGEYVGGLVGFNSGTITNCSSTGNILGKNYVGGLLGLHSIWPGEGRITDCYSTSSVTGTTNVGGLVGSNEGTLWPGAEESIIADCYVTGSVTGTTNVGGLMGSNEGTITNCYSTGSVAGDVDVGGLVGRNGHAFYDSYWYSWTFIDGTISKCYSTSSISGNEDVGGLVGLNDAGTISNCYATCIASGDQFVGGLVGTNWDRISNCYSVGSVIGTNDVGGLVGLKVDGQVTFSFWNTETSGLSTSAGGTGKTTAEMQTAGTFLDVGWDFIDETENGTEDIWWILEGQDYPRLWWEGLE